MGTLLPTKQITHCKNTFDGESSGIFLSCDDAKIE